MGGEGNEPDFDADESNRDGFETDREPLWVPFGPSPGLKRDESEPGAVPSQDKNEPVAEPLQDESGEGTAEAIREWRDQLLRDTRAEPAREPQFKEPRFKPLDFGLRSRRYRATGPSRPRRKWGQAARKAASDELSDGQRRPARSLRAIRESVPLSQAELAYRARLSRATIAALEGGKRSARPKTMRLLAEILMVKVGEIDWP